ARARPAASSLHSPCRPSRRVHDLHAHRRKLVADPIRFRPVLLRARAGPGRDLRLDLARIDPPLPAEALPVAAEPVDRILHEDAEDLTGASNFLEQSRQRLADGLAVLLSLSVDQLVDER